MTTIQAVPTVTKIQSACPQKLPKNIPQFKKLKDAHVGSPPYQAVPPQGYFQLVDNLEGSTLISDGRGTALSPSESLVNKPTPCLVPRIPELTARSRENYPSLYSLLTYCGIIFCTL